MANRVVLNHTNIDVLVANIQKKNGEYNNQELDTIVKIFIF